MVKSIQIIVSVQSYLCWYMKEPLPTREYNEKKHVSIKINTVKYRCTLVDNWIVDHSDVAAALPVGTAAATSSSWLNTWLQWIVLRQLQDERETFKFCDLVHRILEIDGRLDI